MVPAVFAMDFNAGTYYFDNSKVKFSSVRFVAGDTTSCSTIVFEMTPVDGKDWWEFTLSEKLSGIDHFTFIDSELAADTLMQTPKFFVDSLASIMGDSFDRTRDVDTPQSRATIERFAINGINGIGNYGVLATNNQFVSVGIYNGIAVVS